MRMQFVIATHGKLASGALSALELLIGKKRKILVIDAYVEGHSSVQESLEQLLEGIEEPIVVFTDTVGGSVNREVMLTLRERDAYILTDFNLALLLEICSLSDEEVTEEKINACIELCSKQLRCFKMQRKECAKR